MSDNKFFGNITAKTYSEDLPLIKALGLKTFSTNNQGQVFLGQYKFPECDQASVNVYVTCMPAQFWFLQILTEEGEEYEVSTGSGTLTEYWPSVIHVATNCFGVIKIS